MNCHLDAGPCRGPSSPSELSASRQPSLPPHSICASRTPGWGPKIPRHKWGTGQWEGGWPGRGPLGPAGEESLRDPHSVRRGRWKWWDLRHVPGRRHWQLHVRLALSSLHRRLLRPRALTLGPLPPTHPANDHTCGERLAIRCLAWGSLRAWPHPLRPGALPLSSHTGQTRSSPTPGSYPLVLS